MSEPGWDEHAHEALVHAHPHFHVTHNRNPSGGFDHLSWEHEHEHDHPGIVHAHHPHEDFEAEHRNESHIHDHGEPVKRRAPAGAATKAVAADVPPELDPPRKRKPTGKKKAPAAPLVEPAT